jgi:hypothetical protein
MAGISFRRIAFSRGLKRSAASGIVRVTKDHRDWREWVKAANAA